MTKYCSQCGSEVSAGDAFCSSCGAKVEKESSEGESEEVTSPVTDTADDSESWRRFLPRTAGIGIVGIGMGIITGFLLAWGLFELDLSGVGFLVGLVGVTLYLWQKVTLAGAIGSGLYISALLTALVPILIYFPAAFRTAEAETLSETGSFIGSALGLVIWGFGFGLVAIIVASIGYYFKRREERHLAD